MNRIVFEVQAPIIAADPNRADIACFVGFVGRRKNAPVPSPVDRWLNAEGWTRRAYPNRDELLDIPVPIDAWEVFDYLFEWERRTLSRRVEKNSSGAPDRIIEHLGTTYLGAAVRSFFAQGGRKCFVVRVGDPWTYLSNSPEGLGPSDAKLYARCRRVSQIGKLIPGFQLPPTCFSPKLPPEATREHVGTETSPVDRSSWRGIGHLFGLPEISFVSLPDLSDAVRIEDEPVQPVEFPPPETVEFVECSTGEAAAERDRGARFFRAPRCDDEGYELWASALKTAAKIIARWQREVQLVAAIPIPDKGSAAEHSLYKFLADEKIAILSRSLDDDSPGLSSRFVQLAYPWMRTPGSSDLPEQLESPDAVLAGVLARNALMRGAFHSAASLHLADVYDVAPVVRRAAMFSSDEPQATGANSNSSTPPASAFSRNTLLARVSLLGPTPGGLELLSDVTTSLDEAYRPAGINRLVNAIVRAARRLGEESVFEVSGEKLWARVADRLSILLAGLLADGALRGESEADAFQVRCDRSTMSQNDIDNGRIVAEIRFQPAAPIEQITIVLAFDEGGQVSLASDRAPDQLREAA